MWIFKKPSRLMFLDWRGYVLGLLLVGLVTLLKFLVPPQIFPTASSLPYTLAIIITAIYFGFGPSIFASLISLLAYDFLFVAPYFSFNLPGMQEIPTLIIFLLVGIIVSFLTANLRHQTEEAIKANMELQLRATILDKATDGILVRDPDNNILYANDAASDIYGYTKNELINMNLRALSSPQEEQYYEQRIKTLLEKGELKSEMLNLRKDKSLIPLEVHAHRIKLGQKEYIVSVIRDITEQKRIRDERQSFARKLLETQEEERKRIARELHDDTSPTLAFLGLELDAIITKNPTFSEDIIQRLEKVRKKINTTQEDLRRFSHELHPAILDNLGLEPALETLVEELNSRRRTRAQFRVTGTARRFTDEINLALYRITQEALNNIQKHSEATEASVNLEYSSNSIMLSISDNGVGFSPTSQKKGSLGLIGMRERAILIDANLRVESEIGKGTTISVKIPT